MAAKKRKAELKRKTKETDIRLTLELDGSGRVQVKTPVAFLSHMVEAMMKHALFDLAAEAKGDLEVDAHHTVEDLGLVLGEAFLQAIGDKKGITRFGHAIVPMDEALATAAADISGRPYLVCEVNFPERDQWEFDMNLVREFFQAFVSAARLTLHLRLDHGSNYHHAAEALFKAVGRALGQAAARDPRVKGAPSTKGKLD